MGLTQGTDNATMLLGRVLLSLLFLIGGTIKLLGPAATQAMFVKQGLPAQSLPCLPHPADRDQRHRADQNGPLNVAKCSAVTYPALSRIAEGDIATLSSQFRRLAAQNSSRLIDRI